MLLPKKLKHRKWQKKAGSKGAKISSRTNTLSFGNYGLVSKSEAWINSRQLEAARRTMRKHLEKDGKIWIRIFPDKPVTAKGNELPMGGGKGSLDRFVRNVKPGTIIFEIGGVNQELAKKAIKMAGYKLPIKTKFVVK